MSIQLIQKYYTEIDKIWKWGKRLMDLHLNKEQVIDLLRRVCTVSVETMQIVREMPA